MTVAHTTLYQLGPGACLEDLRCYSAISLWARFTVQLSRLLSPPWLSGIVLDLELLFLSLPVMSQNGVVFTDDIPSACAKCKLEGVKLFYIPSITGRTGKFLCAKCVEHYTEKTVARESTRLHPICNSTHSQCPPKDMAANFTYNSRAADPPPGINVGSHQAQGERGAGPSVGGAQQAHREDIRCDVAAGNRGGK